MRDDPLFYYSIFKGRLSLEKQSLTADESFESYFGEKPFWSDLGTGD